MQGEVRRRRGRERVHPRLDPLSLTRSALFPDRFRDRPGDGGRCRGGAGGEPGPGISTPRALRPRSSPRGARPRVFGRRPGQDARAPAGEGGRRRRGGPRWDGGAIRARSLGSWKGALVHSSRASTRSTSPTRPQSWPARVRRRGSMGRESGLFSHLNDVESPPGTAHGPLRCVWLSPPPPQHPRVHGVSRRGFGDARPPRPRGGAAGADLAGRDWPRTGGRRRPAGRGPGAPWRRKAGVRGGRGGGRRRRRRRRRRRGGKGRGRGGRGGREPAG